MEIKARRSRNRLWVLLREIPGDDTSSCVGAQLGELPPEVLATLERMLEDLVAGNDHLARLRLRVAVNGTRRRWYPLALTHNMKDPVLTQRAIERCKLAAEDMERGDLKAAISNADLALRYMREILRRGVRLSGR